MRAVLIRPASIFIPRTKPFAHNSAHSILAMCNFPGGSPALILLLSLSVYASAQMPKTLFKQVGLQWMWMWMKVTRNMHFFLSYLSVLCRISFPFFHRLIAGGEAWGLHSRVTSLPERAFSKALNGLLEKLGGEAAWVEQRKDMKLKTVGSLNLYCDWLSFRLQWEQL